MSTTTQVFQLDIEFAGMCLLVRDPGRRQMHVLLPPVGGHFARLFYDPVHDPQGPSPCAGTNLACKTLSAGTVFDLTGLVTGSSLGQAVHSDIVDLSAFLRLVGAPNPAVPRRHLDNPPTGNPVLCRVTLNDGRQDSVKPGIRWRFAGIPRPLAISLTWRIFTDQPSVTLPIAGEPSPLELFFRNRPMQLAIFNAPSDEFPDQGGPFPHPAGSLEHFVEYYKLFDGVDPGLQEVPEEPEPEQNLRAAIIRLHKARRFTCIAAQAEAEP